MARTELVCGRDGGLHRDRYGQRRRGQQLQHGRGGHALLGVSLDVLGEVVRAHEAAVAHTTPELLLSSMCTLMPGQLVRAREATLTPSPGAAERALAGVGSGVSFQVG